MLNGELHGMLPALIGIVALVTAAGLFVIALPNRRGESLHYLQFYAAPMLYPGHVCRVVERCTRSLALRWNSTLLRLALSTRKICSDNRAVAQPLQEFRKSLLEIQLPQSRRPGLRAPRDHIQATYLSTDPPFRY
jgi:hypothetical protein